ncbi:hypothetical protein O3W44_03715 [Pantoea sp. LMR881]|uniref:hypothetical protein n=1 Tax=Pantoea sp. LMR881 TaxID=3014336 RepID=UPI0022AE718B|nr:hypothetical protein [Pantoea sp. LMR881]MCZ4058384.1 hypothetical protein [Pantoea sp. LMR881]
MALFHPYSGEHCRKTFLLQQSVVLAEGKQISGLWGVNLQGRRLKPDGGLLFKICAYAIKLQHSLSHNKTPAAKPQNMKTSAGKALC